MKPEPVPALIRSFIAIPLTVPVYSAIDEIQSRLRRSLSDVRWTRPDTLHLTLHFFGNISEESLDKAAACMVSIESLFSPFSLLFSGLGAFPAPDRARIFWLGVHSPPLAKLHRALTERLGDCGFEIEQRPFRPHITLGRSRGGPQNAGHILSEKRDMVVGEMTVDRLVLFESELLPTGARHRPRHTIHFTADCNRQ